MLFEDFITLKNWIIFLSAYCCVVFLLFCGLCIRDMEGSEVLTEVQCNKVMERYVTKNSFEIKFFSVNLLKSQLDGLMGEQYNLKIHYQTEGEEKIARFFLKTLNGANKVMFEISKSICAFEKESFYYATFIPLLEQKGLNFDITPKGYLFEPYVIVLEDLALLSYRGTVKSKSLDLKHCKACLKTLATFHAEAILYELVKAKELGKSYSLKDDFRDILEDKVYCQEENGATRFMRCSVKGLFQLIDLIPENGVSKSDFKTKLEDILNDIMASQDDALGFKSTTIHGDLWSSNFLYRYNENDEIVGCKLIDFQTLKYGPPALDVLAFILTNTRKSFRDQYLKELLTYYYSCFEGLLSDKEFCASDVLDTDEFYKSCEVFMLPSKIQAVVDRSITYLPDATFIEASRTEEGFVNFLFEERGKFILKSFKEDQHFKELMTEDVTELRSMLFSGW